MKTKTITKGKKKFKGRTYPEPDGLYLSVTSVIHPDGLDFPPELLQQYASRGLIVHKMTEHFLNYYQWPVPSKVAKQVDLLNVKNGSLNLSIEDCNPVGFFQEYGHLFDVMFLEKKLKNKTHRYAGRADIVGKYENEWCIADLKTAGNYTPDKLNDYWMQLAAYANCITPVPTKLVIIPLNPKSEKGFDAPIVCSDVTHYFDMFLKQLAFVKENYLL
jgi:hypothetical protein